ncbi:hydroxysqualene dehydroxylase [Ureibacillus aquaedulcis]|uniref:FAD-dependent oxidoreductase n=1 Tax=Ureibacillus aquaedulcis TaxID=3058421 RepID=A0ABT8GQK6_9BACL|nr:FAD-dependent oxidoreductase [Ureibacillus sp. BA0131]MDN4493695.1 FAD-dependent oxidoreductase [Ureibacillus sp. BA0131]
MEEFDAIIVGSGLAGLTAALELSENGKSVIVLEKHRVIGGRTASWDENGMLVESGFHRHIGYYEALPKILKKAGVDVDDIVQWEEQIDIRIKGSKDKATFGISPIYGPIDTLKGAFGNNDILTLEDKLSLAAFFTNGFLEYTKNPDKLDEYSVRQFADKYNLSENALHYVVIPLSAGVFFLPPERYSAKVFFGLFLPGIPRFYKLRIGGYLGGMTEILAKPLAKQIIKNKGTVRTDTKVTELIMNQGKVGGVKLEGGSEIMAKHVVVAANLGGAQKILKRHFETDKSFENIFALPTMPAVTIQMEFKKPILPVDRTTFGPLTSLASFAEQSRSTFRHVPGRLSIILTPPEKFLDMKDEDILKHVQKDAKELGLDLETELTDYRIVSHPEDFHSLEPNNDHLRPEQKTSIHGLLLAGDYTRQPFFATMEGAVISGMNAAKLILDEKEP